jgi:hypothetical protein
MARKKKTKASVAITTPTEELQRVLQTAIGVSDLAKHLVRVNALIKQGIASGEVTIQNTEFQRRLQSEMNRVSNLTIQVQDGIVSVRKPSVFAQLWSIFGKSFKRVEGKAEICQAKRLMREQQRSLPV